MLIAGCLVFGATLLFGGLAVCSKKEETYNTYLLVMTEEESAEFVANAERAVEVIRRYGDLFQRQPHFRLVRLGRVFDEDGKWTSEVSIVVEMTELVPRDRIPLEDRLPDTLEGVPVKVEKVFRFGN